MMRKGFKKAYYHGIPAYHNSETMELEGRNCIYDMVVALWVWLDTYVFQVDAYPIFIEENKE